MPVNIETERTKTSCHGDRQCAEWLLWSLKTVQIGCYGKISCTDALLWKQTPVQIGYHIGRMLFRLTGNETGNRRLCYEKRKLYRLVAMETDSCRHVVMGTERQVAIENGCH